MFKILDLESYTVQILILCILYPLLFFVHGEGYLALDSFYHIALAQNLFSGYGGPWLPFTIYDDFFLPVIISFNCCRLHSSRSTRL